VKLYAFDVDETLEISGGPIKLDQMTQLRNEGHIVGICGNWIIFVQAVTGWHDLVSFLSIGIGEKSEFLNQIKQYIRSSRSRSSRRVLVRKGLLTNEEVLEEIKVVRREMEGKPGK